MKGFFISVFKVFYSWGQHFLHLWFQDPDKIAELRIMKEVPPKPRREISHSTEV